MYRLYSYLSTLPFVLRESFEVWGVYETDLVEAFLGLLAYQLLEDALAGLLSGRGKRVVTGIIKSIYKVNLESPLAVPSDRTLTR